MELFAQWFILIMQVFLIFASLFLFNRKFISETKPIHFIGLVLSLFVIYLGGFFDKEIELPQYAIIGIYSIRLILIALKINTGEKEVTFSPLIIVPNVLILIILGFNHFFSFIG